MEFNLLLLVFGLLILSFIGSFIPVIPGPPIAFLALLVFHFFIDDLSYTLVFFVAFLVCFIFFLDYLLQLYGVKAAGGGKYAIRGSIFGILLGLFFFPPLGILLGAFIGAFIGAKIEGETHSVDIAFGALWGFILGVVLKICTSTYITYLILSEL